MTARNGKTLRVEQAVGLTLQQVPNGATHWSSRALASRTGLSQSTVSRIWRAFGLRPHRSETCQWSNDPLLVDQVRDIVGLYLNPPHHAIVLCVDEKSQIQALSRTQPILPMLPDKSNVEPTITNARALPVCSQPWISPRDR